MEFSKLPKAKKIILFDGICNLCNAAVQFIIRHDKKDQFRFVALQSESGIAILKHIGIDAANIDSIVLYEPNIAYYYKSDAVLEVAKNIGGIYILAVIFKVFPKSFRNRIYDYVAKNRYKWYGKKDSCMIPTADLKAKFLD